MNKTLSRRKLAQFVATELLGGNHDVTMQLAAYLLESHRTRECELIVRDVEDILAERGIVIAEVTTARPIDPPTKKVISSFIETMRGGSVHLRERVDPEVLAGIRIELPDSSMDMTAQNRLRALAAHKW